MSKEDGSTFLRTLRKGRLAATMHHCELVFQIFPFVKHRPKVTCAFVYSLIKENQ